MSQFRKFLRPIVVIFHGDIINGLDADLYFNGNLTDQLGNATSSAGIISYTVGQNGIANNAILLDGSTSFIFFNDNTIGAYTSSDFTISLWINPISLSNNPVILFKGIFGTTGFYIQIGSDGSGFLGQNTGGSSNTVATFPPGTISVGSFTHLVITKAGTGGAATYDAYANKINISHMINQQDMTSGPDNLIIGTYNGVPSLSLNGSVDDFRLYHRALSSSEISILYTNGAK